MVGEDASKIDAEYGGGRGSGWWCMEAPEVLVVAIHHLVMFFFFFLDLELPNVQSRYPHENGEKQEVRSMKLDIFFGDSGTFPHIVVKMVRVLEKCGGHPVHEVPVQVGLGFTWGNHRRTICPGNPFLGGAVLTEMDARARCAVMEQGHLGPPVITAAVAMFVIGPRRAG